MRTLLIGLLLTSLVAAEEETSPLEGIAWMVGGQWESKAKLPGGREIESRMVAEFGPGKWSLRMRYYVKQGDKEYEQYETLLWADPTSAGVKYVTFSVQGLVVEGKGAIKDGVMTLEQPKSARFPPMRSTYKLDAEDKDKYVGDTLWNADGKWTTAMRATQTRKPLKAGESVDLPVKHGPLDVLKGFVGGEWSYAMNQAPDATLGHHIHEWSLHGRIQIGHGTDIKGGKRIPGSLSCMWFDPAKKVIQSVSVSNRGTVTHATVTVTEKGTAWSATDLIRNGSKQVSRSEIDWNGKNGYALRLYEGTGEAATLSGELTGKRATR